jgi:quinol monooxygenase YgiN
MSLSLVLAGIGVVVAAVGSGVLLARCFREPRGDFIAWSLALLGLLLSLGAQAVGYLAGFDGKMFRAMEIGGQVIAPLALTLALSEVAGRSQGARFCARLYIGALALVTTVVLFLDQLSDVTFSKAWPNPATYYQLVPNDLLMYVVAPIVVVITVIAAVTVLVRSSQPGWTELVQGQLFGAVAAVLLAYPLLAQLVAHKLHHQLPVASIFTLLCTVAAALTWLAGTRTGRIRLSALHGQGQDERPARADWDESEAAPYNGWRDNRSPAGADNRVLDSSDWWRPEPGGNGRRGQSAFGADSDAPVDATGDIATGAFASQLSRENARRDSAAADLDTGDFAGDVVTGSFEPGSFEPDTAGSGYDDPAGMGPDEFATGTFDSSMIGPAERDLSHPDGWHSGDGAAAANGHRAVDPAGPSGDDRDRAQLFGQIAIYTLVEARIDEFDRLTEQVVDDVRGREPDTLVFIVHAVPSAPNQRILYEVYRDRDAYRRHSQQPYVAKFEADRRPYVLATNIVELGLQQAKVSPFPSVDELFDEPGGYDTSGFERPDYLRDYGKAGSARQASATEYR